MIESASLQNRAKHRAPQAEWDMSQNIVEFDEAPALETERLILQGHGAEDLEANFAMWSKPSVVEYVTRKPSTREESWSRILRYAGHWRLMGYGYWAVKEKGSGRFVGDVGLHDAKRAIIPPLEGFPETGWVLDPAFQGKGYATEAVRAVLSWANAHLSAPKTVCIIAPANATSLRVSQKCGYQEFTRTTYMDSDVVLFQRDRKASLMDPTGAV
jgi:RimJ/RimL family protein N-acetyltransferase